LNHVGIKIYNIKGQVVNSTSLKKLDEIELKTNLTEGMYLIQIDSEKGIFTDKINITN